MSLPRQQWETKKNVGMEAFGVVSAGTNGCGFIGFRQLGSWVRREKGGRKQGGGNVEWKRKAKPEATGRQPMEPKPEMAAESQIKSTTKTRDGTDGTNGTNGIIEVVDQSKTAEKEGQKEKTALKKDFAYRDPKVLKKLYWEERLGTHKMGELLRVDRKTVWNWLKKRGIKTRSFSEAVEKYPKTPFSGNPEEKAYMQGLRAGDIDAYKLNEGGNTIRVGTSTIPHAMRQLVRDVFGVYGHYYEYPVFNEELNQYQINVYSNLDAESFGWILEKPKEVPKGKWFYPFLAGYIDAEGNWDISKSGDFYIAIRLKLRSADYELLRQINEGLRERGFHSYFRLVAKAGGVRGMGFRYTKDYYGVFLDQRDGVVSLAEKLLPYIRHSKKVEKMKLITEIKDEKYWENVKDRVMALREKTKRETEESRREAEEEYKRRHNGRDRFLEGRRLRKSASSFNIA